MPALSKGVSYQIELDYCRIAAERCAQTVLPLELETFEEQPKMTTKPS